MPENGSMFTLRIDRSDAGKRIDAHIASLVANLSRSLAADLLRSGDIRVLGQFKKPGYRLRVGDEIIGRIPLPAAASFTPEPLPLDILHEDADLIVINKPADLVVHPSPGHPTGTLVNGLLHHCPDLAGIGGQRRPGIVHRLDKDTSGVLAVAKNSMSQARLAAQFKGRTVKKDYLALVYGSPSADAGALDDPIGRHPVDRKRMTVRPDGRTARTRWRILERYDGIALLRLHIETGRTHQIRVHCAAMGHPVVGDPVYGSRKPSQHLTNITADRVKGVNRQMLHAWRLVLAHPRTERIIPFTAPLPPDMAGLIRFLQQASGFPDDAFPRLIKALDTP